MLADQSPSKKNEQQVLAAVLRRGHAFFQGPGWIGAKMGLSPCSSPMRPDGRAATSCASCRCRHPGERADPDRILRPTCTQLEQAGARVPGAVLLVLQPLEAARRLYE
jgi:hypothetical protein